MSAINYTPPPTVRDFLVSTAFANWLVGPVGGGKTTGMLFKIIKMAKEQRRGPDGLRKFRACIVRNTANQLSDTTLKSWEQWFPDGQAGYFKRTERTFYLEFDDVRAEVLFRPLDGPDDVRRLLSLEVNVICFDEFREIDPEVYAAATGRVGRYPSKKDGGPYKDDGSPNFGVFGATNPPALDSFWGDLLLNPPDNAKVFFQPDGLGPDAENLDNLPDGYYTNLCEGKSEDWIDVYVRGKLGRSLSGQPVFSSFNADAHVAKTVMTPFNYGDNPLIIGMDFGLTPAAVIGQFTSNGRAVIYDEMVSDGMGALRFAREKLKPLLANKYPNMKALIVGDPAGQQRAQTDERSVFDILRTEGFKVVAAKTNNIVARIAAVDAYLNRQVDGKSGFLVAPECKAITSALRGGYRYRLKTNGEYDDKPEKNAASHIADALQYFCLHGDNGAVLGRQMTTQARKIEPVRYMYA